MDEYVRDLLEERRNELIVRRQRHTSALQHYRDSMLAAEREIQDTAKKQAAIEALLFAEVVDL